MKKRIRWCLLLVAAAILLFTGIACFGRYAGSYFIYRNKEPMKIGATYMTLNNPFFTVIDDSIRNVVEAQGDILISLDPALDVEKQKEQIYYLIKEGVEVIVINPVDRQGLQPALQAAKEAGIPVLMVDTNIGDHQLVAGTIESDNYAAGAACANDMMKQREQADIVLLEHSSTESGKQRIQGFLDTIADHPNYRIVARMECEGQLEIAMPVMEEFLTSGVSFDVVMALNDPSAMGALAAMENQNRLENVLVYGVDGSPEAKALVKDGIMQGTVAQSPITMGEITAEDIYKLLEDKTIEKTKYIPVTLITKENIDDFSLEGWQ